MNYITVSFICIFGLVIGIIGMAENELFSTNKKRRFIILASIIIFEIIIDTISLSIDGKATEYINVYKILKITEFSIVPVIPMLFVKLVTYKSFWLKIRKLFIVLISINVILQIATFFWPIMFKIDADAIYYRTPWTLIYVIILIICFAVLFVVAARKTFTQNTSKYRCTLFLIDVFLLFGMLMRLAYQRSNIDWLCITLGYFVFVFYFSNSYLKVDTVTYLLNQRAFWNYLRRIKYSTAIIIIDANKFKDINDTYGHQMGDVALTQIAELIFKTYKNVGYCYRIGGDEFGVILKPGMLQKITSGNRNFDTYSALGNLGKSLNKRLAYVAKANPMLKYGVSQGYCIYYDNPSLGNYKTIEEVLKIADERMYRQKKRGNKFKT